MSYYVYVLASDKDGVLYIGVTSDLIRRVKEHKEKVNNGFTKKYKVSKLVYFEEYGDVYDAIEREKNMKKWYRNWKIELIEKDNKEWLDLFDKLG